jgi:hypothetical protein
MNNIKFLIILNSYIKFLCVLTSVYASYVIIFRGKTRIRLAINNSVLINEILAEIISLLRKVCSSKLWIKITEVYPSLCSTFQLEIYSCVLSSLLHFHCNCLWFQYHDDTDVGFSSSLACSLVLLLLIGGLQAVILPRTIILLLLFLTAFVWVSVVLMLLLAVRLRWILWDISQSFVLRLAITVFTIVLIYTVAQVNVVSISSNTPGQMYKWINIQSTSVFVTVMCTKC